MKLNSDYRLRRLAGDWMLIYEGLEVVDFSSMYVLNETSAWMWEQCQGKDFTEEDMVAWLLSEYDVDRETAAADVASIVERWRSAGMIKD